MLRIIYLIIFLVVLTIGLGFAVLNSQPVLLDYYFGNWQLSLSLVVVISLVIGALCGILASLSVIIQLKREIAGLRKVAKTTETELVNLRSLPIRDER
mgnify:CR=1 FL=1